MLVIWETCRDSLINIKRLPTETLVDIQELNLSTHILELAYSTSLPELIFVNGPTTRKEEGGRHFNNTKVINSKRLSYSSLALSLPLWGCAIPAVRSHGRKVRPSKRSSLLAGGPAPSLLFPGRSFPRRRKNIRCIGGGLSSVTRFDKEPPDRSFWSVSQ